LWRGGDWSALAFVAELFVSCAGGADGVVLCAIATVAPRTPVANKDSILLMIPSSST
jgi:hypothetical protein